MGLGHGAAIGLIALVAFVAVRRRRLVQRWERDVEARFSFGPDGIARGAEPVRLGEGGRGVLILHGFGDTPQSVQYLATALHASGWTVRVPLLPGHGRSAREFAGSTATEWVEAATRAHDELRSGSTSVAIVGQSLGGAIAVALAASARPVALVLLAPLLTMPAKAARVARLSRVLDLFMPYLPTRSDRSILDPVARASALGIGVSTPRLAREVGQVVELAWRSSAVMTAPTLVIHSANDHRITIDDAERGFARLAAADKVLKWAARGGHVIAADYDREWVAEEVIAWLASHAPEPDSA